MNFWAHPGSVFPGPRPSLCKWGVRYLRGPWWRGLNTQPTWATGAESRLRKGFSVLGASQDKPPSLVLDRRGEAPTGSPLAHASGGECQHTPGRQVSRPRLGARPPVCRYVTLGSSYPFPRTPLTGGFFLLVCSPFVPSRQASERHESSSPRLRQEAATGHQSSEARRLPGDSSEPPRTPSSLSLSHFYYFLAAMSPPVNVFFKPCSGFFMALDSEGSCPLSVLGHSYPLSHQWRPLPSFPSSASGCIHPPAPGRY